MHTHTHTLEKTKYSACAIFVLCHFDQMLLMHTVYSLKCRFGIITRTHVHTTHTWLGTHHRLFDVFSCFSLLFSLLTISPALSVAICNIRPFSQKSHRLSGKKREKCLFLRGGERKTVCYGNAFEAEIWENASCSFRDFLQTVNNSA